MTTATDLSSKMQDRAKRDGLPVDHDLYVLASAMDTATQGFFNEPQTHSVKQFMGAWTRARRAWCEYTGEALI